MSTDSTGTAGPAGEGGGQEAAPTCYRHRDRETWVRCSRCDRPICPDCMIQATVGFQCPECVRSGNRTVREGRTVFGGRVHASVGRVTYVLIGINVAAFIAQFAVPGPRLVYDFGMAPAAVALGDWWRLFTSAFLHAPGSIFHILFNMWALFILGPQLEALLGRLRFTALYFLSALGGSVLVYLIGDLRVPTIGASGAIFGLFGATFVVARRLNLDTRWIVGIVGVNLLITFLVPGISWQGHLGGLVTGAALAAAYAYAPRSARTPVHLAATAGALIILVALIIVRTVLLLG